MRGERMSNILYNLNMTSITLYNGHIARGQWYTLACVVTASLYLSCVAFAAALLFFLIINFLFIRIFDQDIWHFTVINVLCSSKCVSMELSSLSSHYSTERNGTDTFFAGMHMTVGNCNLWILQSILQINWVLYE